MRTNAGLDHQARVMGDPASTGTGNYASGSWIGISTDATAPAAGDTALAGELAANGLQRKQAVYGHTAGASTFTLTATFTSTDPVTRNVAKMATFNAAAAGSMPFESPVPNPVPVATGDQLTVTETVNL